MSATSRTQTGSYGGCAWPSTDRYDGESSPRGMVNAASSPDRLRLALSLLTRRLRLTVGRDQQTPNHTPMPCAIPIGKNAAAAISSGRAPLTAQNTIEVSQAA